MKTPTPPPSAGPLPLVDGPAPRDEGRRPARKPPAGAVAAALRRVWIGAKAKDLIFIAASERRADEVARALAAMTPERAAEVLVFPPWDCLPYDRASPSRESMGRRMAVLAHLGEPGRKGRLLVTSPEAAMQRIPPVRAAAVRFEIAVGDRLDRDALARFAETAGYLHDERVDEPGEIAILGEVVDVYPPASAAPLRVVLGEAGRVEEIKTFDPVDQRSQTSATGVVLTAASEAVGGADDAAGATALRDPHRLAEVYGEPLDTVFDRLPRASVLLDVGVGDRVDRFVAQVREAYETRTRFGGPDDARPASPDQLYLPADGLAPILKKAKALDLEGVRPAPVFARTGSPAGALKRYLETQRDAGRTVVVAALPHERRVIARLLKRAGVAPPAPLEAWSELDGGEAGGLLTVAADLDGGWEDEGASRVVLTPADIIGGRVAEGATTTGNPFGDTEIRPGDVVIHEDHGLGVLEGLEAVEAEGVVRDVLRIAYHGGATLLAPVEEFDRIWRYGSEPSAVALDRLNTEGWNKRRLKISAQIDAAAAQLVEMAEARAAETTPPITPPAAALARFAARFPFPESPDQLAAIEAVAADLASGRPMNRLICGDVGFGKTEVALRAAAAFALGGRQVLVAAPTTVLARQHFDTFRRRFDGTDIQVGHLSRMVDAAESEAVRDGLADGSVRIVVGTQALADPRLDFADLALVVIDEEHRFSARMKVDLGGRAPHLLSLSATPIPRTLQSAMVGIQDISVIASPPARRRPIRTFLADFHPGAMRTVLLREKSRGGQSFVVAPRIEDLDPLSRRLAELTPELKVSVAHGKLAPDEMDAVMTDFADGVGDVLLATNIIENGLDVPRANTLLIWRPDLFGLAQLHQLRGRVGRGRRQGFAYLLSDPDTEMADNTLARLQTLEALDRLGSGFAISARDLDLRGGGDLVGDEQAGHIRLIGAGLYQKTLGRALAAARGQDGDDRSRPKLNLSTTGVLPAAYIPDPVIRIQLYARLARLDSAEEIDALGEEIEDRFGPLPDAAAALLAGGRLFALAAAAKVVEVSSGPKATAFTFSPAETRRRSKRATETGGRWADDRLIIETEGDDPHSPEAVEILLGELAA